jgi:hypothetical protein
MKKATASGTSHFSQETSCFVPLLLEEDMFLGIGIDQRHYRARTGFFQEQAVFSELNSFQNSPRTELNLVSDLDRN